MESLENNDEDMMTPKKTEPDVQEKQQNPVDLPENDESMKILLELLSRPMPSPSMPDELELAYPYKDKY